MSLNIGITRTRILDDHAEYGVTCGGDTAVLSADANNVAPATSLSVVWRRFRDFENLRNSLGHSTRNLPTLPPKYTWWTSRSPAVVNDRQRQLEAFLRETEARLARNTNSWLIFCGFVGANASSSLTTIGSSQGGEASNASVTQQQEQEHHQFSEVQEENLRLKTNLTFLEDEEQRLKQDLARREGELQALKKTSTKNQDQERQAMLAECNRLQALVASGEKAAQQLKQVQDDLAKARQEYSFLRDEMSQTKAELARTEEAREGLRRDLVRVEKEISEKNANFKEESSELQRLKKDKGALELEIIQLEQAQQSAAAYGAQVLAKLEKSEKERQETSAKAAQMMQQLAQANASLEAEKKIAQFLREGQQELQKTLKISQAETARLSAELDNANEGAEKLMNEFTKLESICEEREVGLDQAQRELVQIKEALGAKKNELELVKANMSQGDERLEAQIQALQTRLSQAEKAAEQNANIKIKLAGRVDALVAENLDLKEKNASLDRRMKLLQGD